MEIKALRILCLLITSLLLYSCEYAQNYYDVTVSVNATSYKLENSTVTWNNMSDDIVLDINNGAPKSLFYPVIIKYNFNGNILDYLDASSGNIYLSDNTDNCCLGSGGGDYSGETNGIICNCELDGPIVHQIEIEFKNNSYQPITFYDSNYEYTVALVDPYVNINGERTDQSLRRSPSSNNIICESEVFTFTGGSNNGGSSSFSFNCSNGNCIDPDDGSGQYSSLSACQNACGVTPSWNCSSGNCYDPGTGNGQYSTLSACQNNCINPPPTGSCNISSVSSSPYNTIITPTPNIFNFGDVITVEMYHPSYNYNQGSIELYKNEVFITYLGSGGWVNSQQTFTLPSSSQISASNCYTIRVTGVAGNPPYFNVSSPITIY